MDLFFILSIGVIPWIFLNTFPFENLLLATYIRCFGCVDSGLPLVLYYVVIKLSKKNFSLLKKKGLNPSQLHSPPRRRRFRGWRYTTVCRRSLMEAVGHDMRKRDLLDFKVEGAWRILPWEDTRPADDPCRAHGFLDVLHIVFFCQIWVLKFSNFLKNLLITAHGIYYQCLVIVTKKNTCEELILS